MELRDPGRYQTKRIAHSSVLDRLDELLSSQVGKNGRDGKNHDIHPEGLQPMLAELAWPGLAWLVARQAGRQASRCVGSKVGRLTQELGLDECN